MKYQILFSGKNKKNNISNLSSAELAKRVVKVNQLNMIVFFQYRKTKVYTVLDACFLHLLTPVHVPGPIRAICFPHNCLVSFSKQPLKLCNFAHNCLTKSTIKAFAKDHRKRQTSGTKLQTYIHIDP